MSIRPTFFTALVAFAALASLGGAVFAWQVAGLPATGAAAVGANAATTYLTGVPNPEFIGPPGAEPVKVGDVAVRNDGRFPLKVASAEVVITNIFPQAPGGSGCLPAHFSGTHGALPVSVFVNPDYSSPVFDVFLASNTGAHNDCQGDVVQYRVDVTLINP